MKSVLAISSLLVAGVAAAAPVNYNVDPGHTYPSFEADHKGGLSLWRGKIKKNSGTIVYDKEAKSGTVDITMDMTSIDFGHDRMSEHAKAPDMFDAAKFPTATYKGKLAKFEGERPTAVEGELTLHGVTKPVNLAINAFLCKMDGMGANRKEICGADASGMINREEFGVAFGKNFGFKMDVKLLISVEAQNPQPAAAPAPPPAP